MDSCVACGAELGVGRFCLNCGHPIGAPAPVTRVAPTPAPPATASPPARTPAPAPKPTPARAPQASTKPATTPAPEPETTALPVQAADPTPVPPAPAPAPEQSQPEAATSTAKVRAPRALRPPNTPKTPKAPKVSKSAAVVGPRPESDWDPEVELLPYEEVGDLDADAPLRGRTWIGWVVGALALVGIVFLLLRVFATDDEVATDPSSTESPSSAGSETGSETAEETAPATADAPTGVGKRINLAVGATFEVPATAPPTTDFDGNLVAYEASQMGDGNPTTTWRTAGDATGQTVTVTLAQPGVVSRVGLVNGYAKQVAGVDWYPNNRRILSVTWTFEDGSTVDQTFAERPRMQLLKVPPVQTGTVTITIGSVSAPGSGNLGRDYTAISEISVIGQQAG